MQFCLNRKYLLNFAIYVFFVFLINIAYVRAADSQLIEIQTVAESFHDALAAKDQQSALALLSSDVLIVESGHVETREEYLAHHLAADMEFSSSITSERKIIRTTVEGNTAWIVSSSLATGNYKDHEINSKGAELLVLKQQNGEWKIEAIHWSTQSK